MERSTIKLILSLILFITMISIVKINAQTNESGYIITHGNMLIGQVSVDLESNKVSLEDETKVAFFSTQEAQKASTTDPKTGETKIYYTGTFGMNSVPFLFEAISDGSTPLLYREGVKFNKYEETEYPPYFILKDNSVLALGLSKNEILSVFGKEYQNQMSDFIKANKIKLNKQEGLKALFDHYESVFQVATN